MICAKRSKTASSRLAEVEAGLRWLEYGKALGFLVNVHEAVPEFEEILKVTKSRLNAVSGRIDHAQAVVSDPVGRILHDEIESIYEDVDRIIDAVVGRPSKEGAPAYPAGHE